MIAREIAARAGVSCRQVDHWVRRGYLRPVQRGSGYVTKWPRSEVRVAMSMGRLVCAGLTPEAAEAVARAGRSEAVLAAITGAEPVRRTVPSRRANRIRR